MEQSCPPPSGTPKATYVIHSAADARRFLGEGGIGDSMAKWVILV